MAVPLALHRGTVLKQMEGQPTHDMVGPVPKSQHRSNSALEAARALAKTCGRGSPPI